MVVGEKLFKQIRHCTPTLYFTDRNRSRDGFMPASYRSEMVKTDTLLCSISLVDIEAGLLLRLIVTEVKLMKQIHLSSVMFH